MKNNDKTNEYSDLIKELAKTVQEADLSEIEFNQKVDNESGKSSIHVKVTRNKEPIVSHPHFVSSHPMFQQPTLSTPTIEAVTNVTESQTDFSKHLGAISSPMVGVIYTRPTPDAEDFIKIGSTVAEGDTLLLIEAMKVFNPIKSSKSGKITQILVKSGQAVEYGEVLVVIE